MFGNITEGMKALKQILVPSGWKVLILVGLHFAEQNHENYNVAEVVQLFSFF